jgi:beta-phosphoglucomutase-like phosphatase (HAD superfamily)
MGTMSNGKIAPHVTDKIKGLRAFPPEVHWLHPAPYLSALNLFCAHAEDAIAFEDSSRGLHSALDPGLQCVVIRNAFTSSQDFTGAMSILSSIREVPRLFSEEHQ